MTKTFEVDENTIMWAFRYALGRKTGAVSHMVDQLKKHWENLHPQTCDQIQREIKHAINLGKAGWDCDIESWEELLTL